MGWIQNEYDEFMVSARRAIRDVRHGIHLASWHHIILLIVGVIFCIVGMSGQVLSLNQWLAHFPPEVDGWPAGGPIPVLIMAASFINLAYGSVFLIWIIRKRPSFAALKNPSLWIHGIIGGACLAGNGVFVVFATPHVPEVTQSVLVASQIIWTFVFAVAFKVNHGKNYCHLLVIVALLFSMGGIGLGTAATESGGSSHYKDVGIWSFIFAMGILPGAITNVIAASFFQKCAYDNKADDPVVVVEEEKQWIQSHPDLAAANEDHNKHHGGDPSRKLSSNSNANELLTGYGGTGENNNNTNNSRGQFGGVNASDLRTPLIHKDSGLESSSMATADRSHAGGNNQSRDDLFDHGNNNNNATQNNSGVSLQITAQQQEETDNLKKNQQNGHHSHGKKKHMTENGLYERIDAETGKLLFLILSSVFMLVFTFALFPLDFAPFLGTNPGNATASVHSLGNGLQCVFNTLQGTTTDDCTLNGLFFVMFGVAFSLTNAGQVIVSQFSAPLAAMVSQIASPITAIILVIFPMLSPQPEEANVVEAVFAVILIILGSVVFAFWEQMTSQRQREEQPNPYAHGDDDDDETDYLSNKTSSKNFKNAGSSQHSSENNSNNNSAKYRRQHQQDDNNENKEVEQQQQNNQEYEDGVYGTLEA